MAHAVHSRGACVCSSHTIFAQCRQLSYVGVCLTVAAKSQVLHSLVLTQACCMLCTALLAAASTEAPEMGNFFQRQAMAVPANMSDPLLKKWVKPTTNPFLVQVRCMVGTCCHRQHTATADTGMGLLEWGIKASPLSIYCWQLPAGLTLMMHIA